MKRAYSIVINPYELSARPWNSTCGDEYHANQIVVKVTLGNQHDNRPQFSGNIKLKATFFVDRVHKATPHITRIIRSLERLCIGTVLSSGYALVNTDICFVISNNPHIDFTFEQCTPEREICQ